MKWNQLFSHNTRRQEGTADSLLRLLAPSLLGMAVCVLTLCSLTWAWFNMSVGSSITGIQSSEVEAYLVNRTTDDESGASTLSSPELLVANGNAVSVTPVNSKIYFIARGTAANAYLAVVYNNTTTYYGPLDLKQGPDEYGNYPVYSITLSDASPVSVSLRWGTVESNSTIKDTPVPAGTTLWPDGSNSFSLILPDNEDEESTVAYAPQPQPETPANGDTGDNTNDANKDDAQTPDGSTTGDATGGNTSGTGETGTSGDSGTTGNGNGDDTGTGGDSGTGSGENTGDVGNVTGDAIPEGGSAKASE